MQGDVCVPKGNISQAVELAPTEGATSDERSYPRRVRMGDNITRHGKPGD